MEKQRYGTCKTLPLIRLLGKKWTIPIMDLFLARDSELQFNEIEAQIESINPRNLSSSLKALCSYSILKKSMNYYGSQCYRLTEKGVAMKDFIRSGKTLGVHLYGINALCINRKCAECAEFGRAH